MVTSMETHWTRGRHQPCVQLKKAKSEGRMLGYSSSARWGMGDHSMKEQRPLAVSMVLKGEKFRNSLKGNDTKRKTTFKRLGLLLGIDACRGIQLGLSKLKVPHKKSPHKKSEKCCVNQPLRICNSYSSYTQNLFDKNNKVAKVRRRWHET